MTTRSATVVAEPARRRPLALAGAAEGARADPADEPLRANEPHWTHEPLGATETVEDAAYDDFLGLDRVSLDQLRLLVLTGKSGSGKSTTLAHLVDRHPSFRDRPRSWIQHHVEPGRRKPAGRLRPDSSRGLEELVAVDELLAPGDLSAVAGLLRAGHTVLAASHVHPAWLLPLRAHWPALVLRTDQSQEKILRYLLRKGVSATGEAVERFCRRYGATYTDCQIVLEWDGGRDFDRALARFDACCRIELCRRAD